MEIKILMHRWAFTFVVCTSRVPAGRGRNPFWKTPIRCSLWFRCPQFTLDLSNSWRNPISVRKRANQLASSFFIFFLQVLRAIFVLVLYDCPVYYYPVRCGSTDRASYIVTVKLNSGNEVPAHWVKRGTALLLSLATWIN